jgi:moderate conductance mechanosensitive channel
VIDTFQSFVEGRSGWQLVLLIAFVAVLIHLLVLGIRRATEAALKVSTATPFSKAKTFIWLIHSIIVFTIYFVGVGYALYALGADPTAYIATASVIGLAVGFGSQGLVQDVVTGLTMIFADILHVGDMVEISGQTGVVQRVGIRYVLLENYLGARVSIPNRTINNVVNYERGSVKVIVDARMRLAEMEHERLDETVRRTTAGFVEEFPAIHLRDPEIVSSRTEATGRQIVRTTFRIWPGQGTLVENVFRNDLVEAIRTIDPDYSAAFVAVAYEIETRRVKRQR